MFKKIKYLNGKREIYLGKLRVFRYYNPLQYAKRLIYLVDNAATKQQLLDMQKLQNRSNAANRQLLLDMWNLQRMGGGIR